MASELIIQLQNPDGSFVCEQYTNLPTPRSTYIAISYTNNANSEQLAIELKNRIIAAIKNIEHSFSSVMPRCGGAAVTFNHCYALSIPENFKLLIVVSDGNINTFADNSVLAWTDKILPVIPNGQNVNLPPPFNVPNAVFWNVNIGEVIPSIFGIIGISEEDQKIFISYKRTDREDLAIQLFDRLSHEGFDVFLDRFSINPGVNFQNRLYQELADKAMIVLLESPNYLSSEWVQYEIDFAKQYRLGILAVNTNSSPQTPAVDNEFRLNYLLTPANILDITDLNQLIIDIKYNHSIALYRKKYYLRNNILEALSNIGATSSIDNIGFIESLDAVGGQLYKIWATPRPPKVNDYHFTDTCHVNVEKIIVGPQFQEERRLIVNNWLSDKSTIKYFNEGELLRLAEYIYN